MIVRHAVLAGVLLAACCAAARAEITCDHLAAVAQTTLSLRDDGNSLSRVLSEVERSKLAGSFSPEEMNTIRQTVRLVYTSEVSAAELVSACRKGEPRKGAR